MGDNFEFDRSSFLKNLYATSSSIEGGNSDMELLDLGFDFLLKKLIDIGNNSGTTECSQ